MGNRVYHDGSVSTDGRTTVVDNGDGTSSTVMVPDDGKTNSVVTLRNKQRAADGYLAFHTHPAVIIDTNVRSRDASRTSGVELRVAWTIWARPSSASTGSIIAGASLNDIASSMNETRAGPPQRP